MFLTNDVFVTANISVLVSAAFTTIDGRSARRGTQNPDTVAHMSLFERGAFNRFATSLKEILIRSWSIRP